LQVLIVVLPKIQRIPGWESDDEQWHQVSTVSFCGL
jgi:hypothetical protein